MGTWLEGVRVSERVSSECCKKATLESSLEREESGGRRRRERSG